MPLYVTDAAIRYARARKCIPLVPGTQRGGFGTVYKGVDPSTGMLVAVKVVDLSSMPQVRCAACHVAMSAPVYHLAPGGDPQRDGPAVEAAAPAHRELPGHRAAGLPLCDSDGVLRRRQVCLPAVCPIRLLRSPPFPT